MKMAIDDSVQVLILFVDEVKNSSHYSTLEDGLASISPPNNPPVYKSYGICTVANAHLPPYLIGILRGHILVKRLYTKMVPTRDYSMVNSRLYHVLEEWDEQFLGKAGMVKG